MSPVHRTGQPTAFRRWQTHVTNPSSLPLLVKTTTPPNPTCAPTLVPSKSRALRQTPRREALLGNPSTISQNDLLQINHLSDTDLVFEKHLFSEHLAVSKIAVNSTWVVLGGTGVAIVEAPRAPRKRLWRMRAFFKRRQNGCALLLYSTAWVPHALQAIRRDIDLAI